MQELVGHRGRSVADRGCRACQLWTFKIYPSVERHWSRVSNGAAPSDAYNDLFRMGAPLWHHGSGRQWPSEHAGARPGGVERWWDGGRALSYGACAWALRLLASHDSAAMVTILAVSDLPLATWAFFVTFPTTVYL